MRSILHQTSTLLKYEDLMPFKGKRKSWPFFFQILNSLTLAVESGQTVALVGESGCGKSTVVKLLQRFYDASNGEVSLNLILIEYTVNKIKFRQERVPCVFFLNKRILDEIFL